MNIAAITYVMGYSYCFSETEYKYSQSVTISMCWLDKPPVLIKKEGNKSCFYSLWSTLPQFLLVNIAPFMALKFCSIESMSSRSYTITSLIVKRSPPQSPEDPIARDWRGGGYSTNVYTGKLRPEVQPLTLTLFHEKGTHFVYLLLTNGSPFTYLV